MEIKNLTFITFRAACIKAGFVIGENFRSKVKVDSALHAEVRDVISLTEAYGVRCFEEWKKEFVSRWPDAKLSFSRGEYGEFVVTIQDKGFQEWKSIRLASQQELNDSWGKC
jgi:hypothetical protein